jgi:hypothetical protein
MPFFRVLSVSVVTVDKYNTNRNTCKYTVNYLYNDESCAVILI